MDFSTHLRLHFWICILGIFSSRTNESSAQLVRTSYRTSSTSSSSSTRMSITRTKTTTIRRVSSVQVVRSPRLQPQASRAQAVGRPCPRPRALEGFIQYITVDQNAEISENGKTFPEWTTITYVCRNPGRAQLQGSATQRCVMGIWTPQAPRCATTATQFSIQTSPPLPQAPQMDGTLAVYLTPYTRHVNVTCIVSDGTPQIVAAHVPADSERVELHSKTTGNIAAETMTFLPPQPQDSGMFQCNDTDSGGFHAMNIAFDEARYALNDACPTKIRVPTEENTTSANVTWTEPTMANNANAVELQSTHQPGDRFELGLTFVVYNATDLLGTVDVCIFPVVVEDRQRPQIIGCPEDIVLRADPGRSMTQVRWTEPTAHDNSGNVTLRTRNPPGTYFGIGSFEVMYYAEDPAGNGDTCYFSITVEDREPPEIQCPADIVVGTTPGQSHAQASWRKAASTDNSGYTITLNDPGTEGRFVYGESVLTYIVADKSGNRANCSFTITVKDTEPPRFMNCPSNIFSYIETYRENTTSVRWHEPVADDNVGIAWPWYRSHTPGSRFAVGEHRVMYTVNDLQGNNVSCAFNVTVIAAQCASEKTTDARGTFTWPSITTSRTAESLERCPVNMKYGGHPIAIRFCEFQYTAMGLWHAPRIRTCGDEISPIGLEDLSRVPVTRYNIKELAVVLEAVVMNQTTFDKRDLESLSNTMQKMADVRSPSKRVSTAFVEIMDQVALSETTLMVQDEIGEEYCTLLQTLDRQIQESAIQDKRLHISTETIAVRTVSVYPDDVADGLTFAPVTSDKHDDKEGEDSDVIRTVLKNDSSPMQKHLHVEASIHLPQSLFKDFSNGSALPVSFLAFKDDRLFPSAYLRRLRTNITAQVHASTQEPNVSQEPQTVKLTEVMGPVISASLGGVPRPVNLSEPVVIEFSRNETLNISNINCVFWDFELEEGRGDWSNSGCQFAGFQEDGAIICHCNHLTNFAVLVDIYGQLEIDEKEKLALDIITRIGCFLSIAGLAFTILTFLLFKSLRTSRSRQILVHLCFALLALYIVFVCGIVATRIEYVCMGVAAALHYLVLVTIMWMGVEARHMYVMLVKVFKSERSKFVIKAACVAWGVPLIAVAISVGLSHNSYRNEKYCFLMPGHVMYYGLLLPIGLILIHNIITFSMAIRNLLCSNMTGSVINKTKREQIVSRLQNAVCMSVLLGLTWSFGFLAVGAATFAFRLLFCLFNGFQGLIIFALFCIRSKEVRNAWSGLSLIECNIRSQSYRVKEKSYHANSESAWNGPCVIDWGDAPGLEAYMQANKQRFSQSASTEETRIPTYSINASTIANNKINNGW
ncbi:uncharacterized protein [Diadema antillarum]|uniref:uncharacterized protein n=1 Tax=Diadema antillarum TaxID=105358 RepID=UPI003A865B91